MKYVVVIKTPEPTWPGGIVCIWNSRSKLRNLSVIGVTKPRPTFVIVLVGSKVRRTFRRTRSSFSYFPNLENASKARYFQRFRSVELILHVLKKFLKFWSIDFVKFVKSPDLPQCPNYTNRGAGKSSSSARTERGPEKPKRRAQNTWSKSQSKSRFVLVCIMYYVSRLSCQAWSG